MEVIKKELATPEGLEPPTDRLEICCSIRLSYGVCLIVSESGRQDSNLQPPGPKPGALAIAPRPEQNLFNLVATARVGFEPTARFLACDRLASGCFRPLSHLAPQKRLQIYSVFLFPPNNFLFFY